MVSANAKHPARGDVIATARFGIDDGVLRGFGQAPPDCRTVIFRDMRGQSDPPSWSREGFELVSHITSVRDFDDADVIATIYLEEVRALVKRVVGTDQVFMQSNWVLRAETKEHFAVKSAAGGKVAVNMRTGGFVHVDYDAASAEMWALRACSAEGVDKRPKGRLVVLTAWRAISPPPQDKPLALIDRRTVDPKGLILEQIVAPNVSWYGYQIAANPAQRFCWWSNMTRDEVILFVQHEDGFAGFSAAPHTAFHDPTCPEDTPPRHSIEVRAYAFLRD